MTDEFKNDTAVERVGERGFTATINDRWDALGGLPNGGYLLAICGRALGEVLPYPDPIAVSAFYMNRTVAGPVTLTADVLKVGRRLATGEVRMEQNGKETIRVVGSFGNLDETTGRTTMLNSAPDLPPPEECLDMSAGAEALGVTIAQRFEYRMPELPGWARGEPSGDPDLKFWMRLKGAEQHDTMVCLALVDAAAPAVLELGEFASSTVELTVHVRSRPAPGWLACRASTRHVIDGYHDEDFEVWDSHGKLVAQSRQLALFPGGGTHS